MLQIGNKGKGITIFALIILLGIGFAYLSTQLNISTNARVSGNKWNVYFDNIKVSSGSVSSDLPFIDNSSNTILFTANLNSIGDYYEFTVDVVNDGTIDAVLNSIVMTEIKEKLKDSIDFKITYQDGSEISQNDELASGDTVTYKILVKYANYVDITNLDSSDFYLDLSFTADYIQSSIQLPKSLAGFIKYKATIDNNIDFKSISSKTNGNGIYIQMGTENKNYPIYYYRGNVTDNNAKFAGFCWKIVRTTSTGGVKLIYNGEPDSKGYCSNQLGESTQLAVKSSFNDNSNSPSYNGYMYKDGYTHGIDSINDSYLYANTFTYADNTYTLSNTTNILNIANNHYTCLNDTGTCSNLKYVYYTDEENLYYITINDGNTIDNILEDLKQNQTSSTIKSTLDTWFHDIILDYFSNLGLNYNDFLEDTIWCNDRNVNELEDNLYLNSGWNSSGGNTSNYLFYSTYGRIKSGILYLTCTNLNDNFTVNDSSGNEALTYPVGLLTADDVVLAGGNSSSNEQYYLNTNQKWWTMSAYNFDSTTANNYIVSSNGMLIENPVNDSIGVRPVITIKSNVKIAGSSKGTVKSPYVFTIQ